MLHINYLLQITNNIILKDPNEKKINDRRGKKRSTIDTYFIKKKRAENTKIIVVWSCNCHIIMSVS
jgi:hypothetical protein